MGFKILLIHCYYRISQEQSSSTVIFQTLIWNEGVEREVNCLVEQLPEVTLTFMGH